MAEIPPHLLARANARRAALSGGDAGAPASDGAAPDAGAVATPVAAVAAKAPAKASAPKKPTAVAAPPKAPKGTRFAKSGGVLLLTASSVWTIFMFNGWATPQVSADTPVAVGKAGFIANCAACHGADGAGSDGGLVGRPMWKGNLEKTFPDPKDQLAFVMHGSCEVGVGYGDPKREGGQQKAKSGMPPFGEAFEGKTKDLLAIIAYERSLSNGLEFAKDMLAVDEKLMLEEPKEPLDYEALDKELLAAKPCG